MQVLTAALAYFALVFAVGFMAGPIRVLFLEPAFGKTLAVLMETPILLMAMLWAARFVPRRLRLQPTSANLIGMGLIALALVLAADLCVGLFLRQQTVPEIAAYFATTAGLIYSAALLLFAVMPVLVARRP